MTNNRNGPGIGFTRVKNSARGDPDIGSNNRSRAPTCVLILNYLTDILQSEWERNVRKAEVNGQLSMTNCQ
jgi:hypothetical protein